MPEHPTVASSKARIASLVSEGGSGKVVPGRDVERLTLDIDGRRGPHRRAGRTHKAGSHGILPLSDAAPPGLV